MKSIYWRNYSEYNTWGKRNREWEREKCDMKHKWKEQHISTCITGEKKEWGKPLFTERSNERERNGTSGKILNI